MLLVAYEKLFNSTTPLEIKNLFFDNNINYQVKLNEFSKKFSKDIAFQYLIKRLNQSEEFRNTLIRVIREGKLATYGLNQQTLLKLERDLREKTAYAKTFLIIANKLPLPIETYIKKQPGFQGSSKSPRNIPWLKGLHPFSIYIVRPNEGFRTADELIKKFQYLSEGFDQESLVAVLPIDGIGSKQYTIPANKSFTNENIKNAFEITSYFLSGSLLSDQDIWTIINQSEIEVSEILAIMPFNILVPGIYPSEKDFLIKNYSLIQKKLNVKSLTDWANVDILLLESVLQSIGEIKYSPEERKIVEPNRLRNIASDIIRNSQALKQSQNLLEYK